MVHSTGQKSFFQFCLGYAGDVSPNKLNMLVQGVGVNHELHQLILSIFVFNTLYHIPACMLWTFLRGQSSTESLSPLHASAYYKTKNNTIIIHQIFDKNKKRYSKPQKVSFQRLISRLGWFTAYLGNVLLTELQGPILPWKSRDHINPNHAF